MRLRVAAAAVVTTLLSTVLPADDFTGTWVVVKVAGGKDAFPWSREVKYPKSMTLRQEGDRLVGSYTDQEGYSDAFELVAVVNQGRDLLLVHSGAGTKEPTAFSPVHHAKLVKGRLHAIVTSHDKLFEWWAERK